MSPLRTYPLWSATHNTRVCNVIPLPCTDPAGCCASAAQHTMVTPTLLTSPWTIIVWCCMRPSCSRLRVIGNMTYVQPACIKHVHVYPYVHGHVHLFPRRTRERATTWSHPVEQRALHPTYFASLRSWARTASSSPRHRVLIIGRGHPPRSARQCPPSKAGTFGRAPPRHARSPQRAPSPEAPCGGDRARARAGTTRRQNRRRRRAGRGRAPAAVVPPR